MQRFLRARKLWKYITGDAQPPHFSETDEDDDTLLIQYQSHLEDWDSVNSKIITWFSNTSVSSIHSLFTPFETAKEVWDYLAERYSSVDGANEYQLGLELHHLRFDSVGQALAELRSEETRKKTMVYQHSQPVLATPTRDTHSYEDCRSRSKPKRKGYHNRQTAAVTNSSGPSPDSPSSTLTTADVETIVTQVLSRTNLHSSALSTTSADGSLMTTTHTGTISTPALTIDHAYLVPALSHSLLSVGQLCELGFHLHFSNSGCLVQDPRMGKTIGTSRKVGRLFELESLHAPHRSVAAVSSSSGPISFDLWHSRLEISKTPPPSGLGRPLFTDPSLDIILPVTSPSPTGSPPSPSLPSRIMAVPDVSPPAAPPSVPCPPVRSFHQRSPLRVLFCFSLYVDDMIITGDDLDGIATLKKFLSLQFEMKDLGSLSYFLGIEVSSTSDGYSLSQTTYASDLLSRAGLTDNKTVDTPLENNVRLNTSDGEPLSDPTLYRQLVGSLIYLTVTRPDISHAVHIVSQFMSAPRSTHYAAALRILRYVKGTIFHGLHFSSHSSLILRAYSDADWAVYLRRLSAPQDLSAVSYKSLHPTGCLNPLDSTEDKTDLFVGTEDSEDGDDDSDTAEGLSAPGKVDQDIMSKVIEQMMEEEDEEDTDLESINTDDEDNNESDQEQN
ncbi:hypothetical protein Acr_00g0086240 [Actinidia rufa]|uniref:Reverse transcriptase Ty1/copia-type domain-containing protein n=1 Tax=Actinidia rufa TaxID=165716 RepID=A0A7J0DXI7_9ERIC|nr:hypothetical protein Acr_00g0086240 [Actinidia rufa]